MNERLLKFIKEKGLSSIRLAEEIHVQPSSISHIISGRNKPSYDFITKLLSKYSDLSADWLLLGKGQMYKSVESYESVPVAEKKFNLKQSSLFNQPETEIQESNFTSSESKISESEAQEDMQAFIQPQINESNSMIDHVIIFYTDGSFKSYKNRG